MDIILSALDGLLIFIYLFVIGKIREKNIKHHSLLLKKLVLALAVAIVSGSILMLIPDHSFHLLQAFSMGGVIYSVLLVLLTVTVTFLMRKDKEKYNKAVKLLNNF